MTHHLNTLQWKDWDGKEYKLVYNTFYASVQFFELNCGEWCVVDYPTPLHAGLRLLMLGVKPQEEK